jgi:lambda family phage minor tail protein L
MATRAEESLAARKSLGASFLDMEPTAILEFYEFYFAPDQEPFRFHSGTNNLTKDIVWNGKSYYASAIEVEGFEANLNGRLPRPKITASNKDYTISNILRDYSDFRNGKFVRIKVFLRHLDNVNFDSNLNPFGVPSPYMYISKEKYLISQKIMENKQIVQFELITPFDMQSLETAGRGIYGRYCYWQYRGLGCNYQGDVICKEDDTEFFTSPNSHIKTDGGAFVYGTLDNTTTNFLWVPNKAYIAGDVVCLINSDLNGIKDPPLTWFVCKLAHTSNIAATPNKNFTNWEKDGCSKTMGACKKRFVVDVFNSIKGYKSNNDSAVSSKILPFGGFPGTDKFRYD